MGQAGIRTLGLDAPLSEGTLRLVCLPPLLGFRKFLKARSTHSAAPSAASTHSTAPHVLTGGVPSKLGFAVSQSTFKPFTRDARS